MLAQFRKLPIGYRARVEEPPGVVGPVRLDRRTKDLTKRACPGDIVVIDHQDLDWVSADGLVSRRVAAVVNVSASISGRYPNHGPQVLLEAGIPLVDGTGPEVFERVLEGATVRLCDDTLYAGDEIVAKGRRQTAESVAASREEAKAGVATELEAFVCNTLAYMAAESSLLVDGVDAPELRVKLAGRHVLVVTRGYHYREDLATLRPYIREYKPVLIGVDGGADALLESGYRPHLIVGDMDSVSDQGLSCGAELVVHAYPDGRAPGLARVEEMGLTAAVCPSIGTSEDVALLLADQKDATLIVAVGTHFTMDEFLDKGRAGYSSTLLTRLRLGGGKLVDAKGVSRLYRSRVSGWAVLALVLAALLTIVAVFTRTPVGQVMTRDLLIQWDTFRFWLARTL